MQLTRTRPAAVSRGGRLWPDRKARRPPPLEARDAPASEVTAAAKGNLAALSAVLLLAVADSGVGLRLGTSPAGVKPTRGPGSLAYGPSSTLLAGSRSSSSGRYLRLYRLQQDYSLRLQAHFSS